MYCGLLAAEHRSEWKDYSDDEQSCIAPLHCPTRPSTRRSPYTGALKISATFYSPEIADTRIHRCRL
jgi:hypothetical protein